MTQYPQTLPTISVMWAEQGGLEHDEGLQKKVMETATKSVGEPIIFELFELLREELVG